MNKLLAIDDCSSIRAFLKKLAWQWDIETISVDNGRDALTILAQPDAPQILMVDWMMPGMDGLELIRRVRRMPTDKPRYIIVMTAKTGVSDVEEAFEAGADDFMPKPLRKEELRLRLDEAQRVLDREETVAKAFGKMHHNVNV
jgi:DNA-binding response OmpR family regulator